jgi:CheY-like chemotaxis protein
MKTILVLSPHPDFAETIRASLNPEQYRVVHRLSVDEAEPLLMHGLAAPAFSTWI